MKKKTKNSVGLVIRCAGWVAFLTAGMIWAFGGSLGLLAWLTKGAPALMLAAAAWDASDGDLRSAGMVDFLPCCAFWALGYWMRCSAGAA